jgi:hypothetical protein
MHQVSIVARSYLIHQYLDTGIQSRGDGFIQGAFETFLFLHGAVQEICLIDIGRLYGE